LRIFSFFVVLIEVPVKPRGWFAWVEHGFAVFDAHQHGVCFQFGQQSWLKN
jgi:hypothetical protein